MKKIGILFITLILSVAGLFALNVDEKELKKVTDGSTIEFINYTGPHKVIDSIQAIREIGAGLGRVVAKNPEQSTTAGNENKYYVIHAVDPNEKGKLDADILFIGKDATVDHVTNLRRIIGAYLETAYGYDREDADALAVFVTVYNAVYRGKLQDLQDIYKTVVTKNLSVQNCGLSTTYKDWPGKSEIIIPLHDVKNGGISTVDTSVISDSKVVDSMKEDDDKNVDSRKQMVDIKERESEEATDKAKESQKQAVEEQKKLDQEKEKAEEVKKEAEEKKEIAEEKKEVAEKNPDDQKAQEEAKEAEKEAEEAQQAVVEQEQKVEEQQTVTDQAKQEAKEQQEFADKKQTEAQSERKEIAKDQQDIQKQEALEAKQTSEYGLVIVNQADMLSRLVKFDTKTGTIIKNSPVAVIRNRVAYSVGDSFIAVAGEDTEIATVKLVLIDKDSMEITQESALSLAPESVLVQDGEDYYCVVNENGQNFIAKFGSDLTMKLKSTLEVNPCTPITLTSSGIVVTSNTGIMKILGKDDLAVVDSNTTPSAPSYTPSYTSSSIEVSEK